MASPLDLLPNGMLPPFLDNLFSGALNPKGNFGDYAHAHRTFNKHQFRLAPKVKFLYHVYFDFSPAMKQILRSIIPNIFNINFKKINLDSIPKTNFKPFIKRKNANKNIKCPVKIIL